ncbi:MAG: nucleotide exchange factor GrpE [Actinomycetota bacterium]|nr:nucleotide exchange factor GrpE [Actinomycetota bacterium]
MSFPDDAPQPGVEAEDRPGQDGSPGEGAVPAAGGDVGPGGVPTPEAEADRLDEEPVDGEPEAEQDDPFDVVSRERDDYLDALRRLQADFENYKKRMAKQQIEQLDRAAEALVEKLLPVLDTADLALAHGGGEEVKQLAGTLSDALEREGLERIDPAGAPFDPNLHDAVAHEPGDEDGQVVSEVMRAGYRWRGRVLRPAMVKVRG